MRIDDTAIRSCAIRRRIGDALADTIIATLHELAADGRRQRDDANRRDAVDLGVTEKKRAEADSLASALV